ncbi:XdhC family protein [Candidatus Izemoplasma sp. B36]|uniref:XdhC family protein n=1 Tax=Candidatus Izemoplasma sp. B36 TaxID=3242468 RepID=UPI003558613B
MSIYDKISTYRKQNISLILVTAVSKEGSGPVEVGKKMIYLDTDKAYGTVGGGALEYYAREKCKDLLKTRTNLLETYYLQEGKVFNDAKTLPMACGGKVTLFYEYIGPQETIYVFGAGHVGQALVNVLKTMNFHVTVIDDRKEVIDNFKNADILINKPFVKYIEEEGLKTNSFIIVCTPNHKQDYHVINKVIELDIKPKYMGMLCSPEKLDEYLTSTYKKFGKDIDLSYFYSPIGLDLGGGSPEEIAISITSEILAISNDKKNHSHMRSVFSGKNHYWKN